MGGLASVMLLLLSHKHVSVVITTQHSRRRVCMNFVQAVDCPRALGGCWALRRGLLTWLLPQLRYGVWRQSFLLDTACQTVSASPKENIGNAEKMFVCFTRLVCIRLVCIIDFVFCHADHSLSRRNIASMSRSILFSGFRSL